MQITGKFLKTHGACRAQRALFRKVFGEGGRLTVARLNRARKAGLRIGWLERFLPPGKNYQDFMLTTGKRFNDKWLDAPLGSKREAYWAKRCVEEWVSYIVKHLEAQFGKD